MYRNSTSERLGRHCGLPPGFCPDHNLELSERLYGDSQAGTGAFRQEPRSQCSCHGLSVRVHAGFNVQYKVQFSFSFKILPPQAVDITSCGNFAVIALSSGHIDVYNMQSGLHRGQYGQDRGQLTCNIASCHTGLRLLLQTTHVTCDVFEAHSGPVRGVSVDALNQLMVSAGADRLLKVWKFKSKELLNTHRLQAAPASTHLHRDR